MFAKVLGMTRKKLLSFSLYIGSGNTSFLDFPLNMSINVTLSFEKHINESDFLSLSAFQQP